MRDYGNRAKAFRRATCPTFTPQRKQSHVYCEVGTEYLNITWINIRLQTVNYTKQDNRNIHFYGFHTVALIIDMLYLLSV